MPTKKHISNAARRRQNHLRLQGLKVADVYMARLEALRRKELKRVLALCRDNYTPDTVPLILQTELREGYLMGWWQKLWMTAGPGAARATAEELRQEKAAAEENFWLRALRTYATRRAGENITIVSGTWKDSLVKLTRKLLDDNPGIGVEKLTGEIFRGYRGQLEEWQCRRIAQTETLIGMADAGRVAADTLEIPFTKQWCTSGLPNVRESHQEVDGMIVDENEPFELPGGSLMYPHDTSLQADASEIINCACACIRMPKNDAQSVVAQEPAPFQEVAPAQLTPEEQREQRIQEIMAEMDSSLLEDTRRKIAENDLELEKALGITKGAPMSEDLADKQSANPNYVAEFLLDPAGRYVDNEGRHFSRNPLYKASDEQYSINCATCSPTYILRKRGFNITAKGNVKGSGSLMEQASRNNSWAMWKNADGSQAVPDTYYAWMKSKGYKNMTEKRFYEFFNEKCKEPGDYVVTISWKGRGAHATILSRDKNGVLSYIEPQSYLAEVGVRQSIAGICKGAKAQQDWSKGVMRVDNKIFNTHWAGLFNTK